MAAVRNDSRLARWISGLLGILCLSCATAADSPEQIQFFESKIRPILSESCYSCHSHQAEKLKGGLYLDSREGTRKGGDSGPAIIPGKPEESLLIRAVRYQDENLQMPPKNRKLSAEQISALEKWIAMGAPDPRTEPASKTSSIWEKARTHWAFQPVRKQPVPRVRNGGWVQSPIDAFVLAGLEARKLKPSPPADRRTLLRRVTYDLIGLPPTPLEMAEFESDRSPRAFEKVVDRLLASPHYGERWGRIWLDVARYSDTKGDTPGGDPIFPYAYSYRDYVIRAFNEDLPYDQFIVQQLAADLVETKSDLRTLPALGFITVGRRFLNNIHDTIDDRIDTVCQGFLGLTVACARCHDHKFDPIPTQDYYSLYGVFSNTYEPAPTLIGMQPEPRVFAEYQAARQKAEKELADFRRVKAEEAVRNFRRDAARYLEGVAEAARLTERDKQEALIRNMKLQPVGAMRWKNALEGRDRDKDPIFAPWFALAALPPADFGSKANAILERVAGGQWGAVKLNREVISAFAGKAPASLHDVALVYGAIFEKISKQWEESIARDPKIAGLPDPDAEQVRQILYGASAPGDAQAQAETFFDLPTNVQIRQLSENLDRIDATHPGSPPRAMIVADSASPTQPHVFVRGNPNVPGPEAPRRFLKILSPESRPNFTMGSGRLELARDIASTNNPLTARVFVNRVWMHHFGAPLVQTPGDFGIRTEPPSNPALLDFMAAWFMENGWSVKKLHKLILLSRAYQESSDASGASRKLDPENRLLSHLNRKRLDFEATRDTLLALGGDLDFALGGKPVQVAKEPFPVRRTVYAFVDRQDLPQLFRAFDFANPDVTTAQRFDTTVPQQALYLLNSPFVGEQAAGLARRMEVAGAPDEGAKIRALFQLCYQRNPTREELSWARGFLQKNAALPPKPAEVPRWQYGIARVDPQAGRLTDFQPFGSFNGSAWLLPSPQPPALSIVFLNAIGGIPGADADHAVVRRWTAPADGVVRIESELSSQREQGDGVRGEIFLDGTNRLGRAEVAAKKSARVNARMVRVQKGQAIDFAVDCKSSQHDDVFHWTIKIRYQGGNGGSFDSLADFKGPEKHRSLSPFEQLAQALLLSNELVFLD